MSRSEREAFSKPWAWAWSVIFAVASGFGAYVGVAELNVGWGWAVAAGLVGFAVVGGCCAFYASGRGGGEDPPVGSDVGSQL